MFRAHVLIIRRSKLHYTASGIITPIGGRLVHDFCASSWLITENITEMHGQQNVKISTYVPGHNQYTLREHTRRQRLVSTLDSGHHQAMTQECEHIHELKATDVLPWPDDAPSLGRH